MQKHCPRETGKRQGRVLRSVGQPHGIQRRDPRHRSDGKYYLDNSYELSVLKMFPYLYFISALYCFQPQNPILIEKQRPYSYEKIVGKTVKSVTMVIVVRSNRNPLS